MEYQLSYFKSWKMMLWNDDAAFNMPVNLENSAVATGLETFSFHSSSKERQCQKMFKLPHNCTNLTHQQTNAQNFPSQALTVHELWTSRYSSWIQKRQRNQRSNWSVGSSKKQENFRKISASALLTMPKPLTVWITTNCGTLFKRWDNQTTWPASWEICMQVKKKQLETDMEKQIGSNWKRSMSRLYIVTLLI